MDEHENQIALMEELAANEAAGGASGVERVVRLLIEADNSTKYTHVMVRKNGNDITTVGNLLVKIMGKLAPLVETEKYGMTLYDHCCAIEKELEKPVTIHPAKRPNNI